MLYRDSYGSMALRLDGRKVAGEIEKCLKDGVSSCLKQAGRPPGLAVIRIGDDAASAVYISNKEKACARIGVKSLVFHFNQDISTQDVIKEIEKLNRNELVDGILVQLPLPKQIDEAELLKAIDPDKDADGLHTLNLGRLLKDEEGPRSCTPAGVMMLLDNYQIPIEGKRVVVIGRSILVGKPMALMLQSANATVTVAHSRTRDLASLTKQADLLVVAAGKPRMIGPEYIKDKAVVVDVGIHRQPKPIASASSQGGKTLLCGDVCFEEVSKIASAITPVPGGVGPMTVSMLLVNTINSWKNHCGLSLRMTDLLP